MKRKVTDESTTPGEVISPLEHTHHAGRLTDPGETLTPMSQESPSQKGTREKKTIEDNLARPPKDKSEVTIGPTTTRGPDVSIS